MGILFLNIVVNFWALTAALVMVELLIHVYIVLNLHQLRGLLLRWKLLAGSMMLISRCCIPLPFHICISIFLPLPLIFLKNECRIGGFFPLLFSQSHNSFLKTGKNFQDQVDRTVFKKLRLFETPSLGKDLPTSLLCCSPSLINCYSIQCVSDTPPASTSRPFQGNLSNNGV